MTDDTDMTPGPSAGPDATGSRADQRARRSGRGRVANVRTPGLKGRFMGLPLWGRISIGVPLVLVVVVTVLVIGDVAVSFGRVHPGVRVSGVSVGTLTRADAEKRLGSQLGARLGSPVTASFGEKTWDVTSERLSVVVNTRDSVERALSVGNSGTFSARVGQRVKALFGGVEMSATVEADPSKVTALLDEIDETVATSPTDARVEIKGTAATLVPSKPGIALRRAVVTAKLLAAFAAQDRVVGLDVDTLPPHVADADARQALEDAVSMLSGPAKVDWESRSWDFQPSTIAGWISFRPVAPGSENASESVSTTPTTSTEASSASTVSERRVLQIYLDPPALSETILPLTGGIGRPAVNAKFVVDGGRITVSGGQIGLGPDVATLAGDLGRELVAGGSRRAKLRLASLQPELTAEKAKEMGIVERISTYTTTYPAGAKDRVNNIHTLATALNDKLIPPGGTFDFNATVGERTAAKGYREAPAIVNGKLVPQLGGGICQIGTTFFNTVFFSGLPVVERKNHSFYISHYPKGRDCTVTWGGPNLRWTNDTSTWIVIKTAFTNSSVTISLYGTDPGYDVAYTTTDFMNIRPHPVVEVPDPTLLAPARVIEDGGVDGSKVIVVRTVSKGGVVVRTDTFVSLYKPKEETVRVGTKIKSVPTTSTP
jgi:vancomycin resistance protein YoaR